MGNVGSNIFTGRRMRCRRRDRHSHPQPELSIRNVYAAAYTSQYPNHPPPPNAPYYQHENGACYPPPPLPLSESHDDRYRMAMGRALEAWVDGCYPPVDVDHQTVTINHNFNLKKETLKIEADEENPGKSLVSFTFDASAPCSITLYFFEKEREDCSLMTTKEDSLIPPFTLSFQQGLGQKFRQTTGTGIDLSMFEEEECKSIVVKAESCNSQITHNAVVEKDKGGYKVRVVKQILWVEGVRYDLEEIYGGDSDGNNPGKECVICLSAPQDTTVLPCRHMCMCNGCAKVLRFQTNRCPICRQPVERLLVIKANSGVDD